MMGVQDLPQGKLYYTHFNLDQRIRPSHPLRKIDQLIDFNFIYQEGLGSDQTNNLKSRGNRTKIPIKRTLIRAFLVRKWPV